MGCSVHIAIGVINLTPGGTEFQMCLLAKSLQERGHHVTFYQYEPGQFIPMCPTPCITRVSVPIRFNSCSVRFMLRVFEWRRWLRADRPDITIGALALPHLLLNHATLGLGIPIVGRRGFAWEELDHLPNYHRAGRYLRMVRRWSSLRTRRLVCNALHVANSAHSYEGWSTRKITIVHNGWPEFQPIDYSSLRAVYSARSRVEKDFSIIGVERVTSVPFWPNVGIYVHPTMAEGCSNSIGMAMAHGIPVVAYRTKGNIEQLGTDYPALVDVGNVDGLREWVSLLRSSISRRRRLGTLCHNRVRSFYSLKLYVDNWEKVFDEACYTC